MAAPSGRSVEALFDDALKLEAEEFAKLLTEEDRETACDAVWALHHYFSGNESREEQLKKIVAALEKALPEDQFKGLIPLQLVSAIRKEQKPDLSLELKRRTNTRCRKWDTYDVKEEEAEGFCKLWAYLLHELNRQGADEVVRYVQSCIGTYSLFPHRCADVILSVWEYTCSLDEQKKTCAGAVLRSLGVDVQELVGYRYLHHHIEKSVLPPWVKNSHVQALLKDPQGIDISFYDRTPASLHKLAGHLIKEGLLFYSDLIPYLQPSLEVLQKEAEDYITKKLAVVAALSNLDKKGLDAEFYGNACKKPNCYKFNDHYGVILGVVHAGAYDIASSLLSNFASLQPMTYTPLANGVASELQRAVSQLMAKINQLQEEKNISDDLEQTVLATIDGLESMSTLATHLGHRLSTNLKLFSMLVLALQFCCQNGHGCKKAKLTTAEDDDEENFVEDPETNGTSQTDVEQSVWQRLQKLIVSYGTYCFLPALSVMTGADRTDKKEADLTAMVDSAPPTLSHGVWALLEYLPFRHRFQLYENVTSLLATDDFELKWASAKLSEATARTLRRLTTDNSGELAKKLAKLSFCSPLILFTSIFRHVMNYGTEFIPHAIDAMKQFPPLALDVMSYKMISLMSDETKPRLKNDKVNLDDWLSNLGHFVAQFFKKQAVKYDVNPMLEYVLWRARMGKTTELTVLTSMLRAAGIDSTEDLSDVQVDALELGSYARTECISLYDQTVDNSKNAQKQQMRLAKMLRKTMRESGIAHQTVLALAVIYTRCMFDHDIDMEMGGNEGVNLRMLKEEHARVSTTLVQLVLFIQHIIIPEERARVAHQAKGEKSAPLSFAASGKILPFTVCGLIDTYGVFPAVAQALCGPRAMSRPCLLKDDAEHVKELYGVESVDSLAEKLLPEGFRDCLSLYVAFWTLNLQDISDAADMYRTILEGISKRESDEDKKGEKSRDRNLLANLDRMRNSVEEEQKQQASAAKATQTRLRQNSKAILGPFGESAKDEKLQKMLSGFFQTCLWPRMLFSGEQAIFSARLLKNLGQIGFPVYQAYLFVCKAIPRCLASCTTIEAQRIALFLKQVFSDWLSGVESKGSTKEEFASGHAGLARGLLRFFNKGEPIHEQKLAFEVLRAMEKCFPMHEVICSKIEDAVRPLSENESIKASATIYTGMLQRRRQHSIPNVYSIPRDTITAYLEDRTPPPPRKEKEEVRRGGDRDGDRGSGLRRGLPDRDRGIGMRSKRDRDDYDSRDKRPRRNSPPPSRPPRR
eukprot:TRINITY_DN27659_c0_g1_i1.p1 TRINITY_DN27659_c0_g1~~TRINITY_DN27659_c0_g1_i1.p1  ORF type:complete len:1262 (+),score=607.78 TRINITY_DN27659_c0_g1_i1:90-3875(+)